MGYGQNTTVPDYKNAQGQTPAERWRFSVINDMMLSIDHPGIDYNNNINKTMEGQHALRIFTDVVYEIESEGWEFNTIDELEITLNSEGKYQFGVTEPMPLGALAVFSDRHVGRGLGPGRVTQAVRLFLTFRGVLCY